LLPKIAAVGDRAGRSGTRLAPSPRADDFPVPARSRSRGAPEDARPGRLPPWRPQGQALTLPFRATANPRDLALVPAATPRRGPPVPGSSGPRTYEAIAAPARLPGTAKAAPRWAAGETRWPGRQCPSPLP